MTVRITKCNRCALSTPNYLIVKANEVNWSCITGARILFQMDGQTARQKDGQTDSEQCNSTDKLFAAEATN